MKRWILRVAAFFAFQAFLMFVLMGCASNAQRAAEMQAQDQRREQMLAQAADIDRELEKCTLDCYQSDRYKYLMQSRADISMHTPR